MVEIEVYWIGKDEAFVQSLHLSIYSGKEGTWKKKQKKNFIDSFVLQGFYERLVGKNSGYRSLVA